MVGKKIKAETLDDDLGGFVNPGAAEAPAAVSVRVAGDPAGRDVAYFWPESMNRYDVDTRDQAEILCGWVGETRHLRRQIDRVVPVLRDRGMSWGEIGWCTGMSDEGARKRWGADKDPTA
jgi:hypothetical protein